LEDVTLSVIIGKRGGNFVIRLWVAVAGVADNEVTSTTYF
jgi:hypothetical protein